MKILITGGAGFIGSAVIRLAISRGFEVINVDSLTYAACEENLESIRGNSLYTFKKIDIRNKQALDKVFLDHKPDLVMHLAAESHVDRSIESPNDFIETNIIGTYNMLEASRKYWFENGQNKNFKFHHISTDEVYGSLPSDSSIKFHEETPYDPRSPYSASKASSDHLVRAWHETFSLPIVISNCSNNYGPFHFPEKLIPVVIINALDSSEIPVYGDGSNIRDWLYVEDHAKALLLVAMNGKVGRNYNIGGNNECSNIKLVEKICEILDRLKPNHKASYKKLIKFVSDRPGHDARYSIDAKRIMEELGWRPSVTLDEGLELTVKWYLENESWWRPLLKRKGVGLRLGIIKDI